MRYDDELKQVTEGVFSAMIGPVPASADPDRPAPDGFVATVRITGAWSGAVTIYGSAGLARMAAAAMFGFAPEETCEADARDAIGEIGNMIGGNIKSLLPGDCTLSIPCVGTDGTVEIPGTTVGRAAFDINGEPLIVMMVAM